MRGLRRRMVSVRLPFACNLLRSKPNLLFLLRRLQRLEVLSQSGVDFRGTLVREFLVGVDGRSLFERPSSDQRLEETLLEFGRLGRGHAALLADRTAGEIRDEPVEVPLADVESDNDEVLVGLWFSEHRDPLLALAHVLDGESDALGLGLCLAKDAHVKVVSSGKWQGPHDCSAVRPLLAMNGLA